MKYYIGLPNNMLCRCEESITSADTYEIQNETKCNYDNVNFYQASQALY